MRRGIGVLFLFLFSLPGAARAEDRTPAVLSFLHPISTNGNRPDVATGLRLSLLYGRAGSVGAVDLNGLVSLASADVTGLHVSGVYSQIGGDLRGVSFAGVLSNVQGNLGGAQLALAGNLVQGNAQGFQSAVGFNTVFGSMEGVQIASGINLVDGDARFLQIATLANTAGGTARGLQVASGLNYAGVEARALQLGGVNLATRLHGAQVGVLNLSGDAQGAQIGAINVAAGEFRGVPVGLMSFAHNGSVDWVTYSSNLVAVNSGIRTTVNRWTSMFTLGGIDLQGDVEEAASVSWNFGRVFPVAERVHFSGDLGMVHLIPEKQDDPALNDALHFALQARVLGEWRFSPRAAAFAGAGVSQVFDSYTSGAGSETEPLFLGGVSLF
jgi:hypothetical protein